MIGAAVAPVWVILVLLMLRSEHGLSKALAFAAGAIAVRLVQGVVFGGLFGGAQGAGEAGGGGPGPSSPPCCWWWAC
jgi:hypothetical protein